MPTSKLVRFAVLCLSISLVACGGGGGGGVPGGSPAIGTVYYVDASQLDDSGDGLTKETARKFLHTAVASAMTPATIRVAAGEYRLSNALGTQVVLRDGVSLYGGYNAQFSVRNAATYITTIEDRSTTGGSSGAPHAAIVGSAGGITPDTTIDGFVIQGSTQGATETAAFRLYAGAAPNIQNNVIVGGTATRTYGVHTTAASPVVHNNRISGGTATQFAFGLYNDNDAAPSIYNNTVHGGTGTIGSIGITNVNSSPIIRNNTVYGGEGPSVYAVFSSGATSLPARPRVDNNILFTRSGGGAYCFYEAGQTAGDANPTSFRNNDLWNCAVAYYDDGAGCSGSSNCSVAGVNLLTGISGGVGGNVSANPQFADFDGADNLGSTVADNNWQFSGGSPASVTAGGLNGLDQIPAWPFTTDANGVARLLTGNPWSIGAYQL